MDQIDWPKVKIEATPGLAQRWSRTVDQLVRGERPDPQDLSELWKVRQQIEDQLPAVMLMQEECERRQRELHGKEQWEPIKEAASA